MSRPAAFRCATEARSRDDQLAGTASRAHGWVVIEHPGPWPFAGFAELYLADDLKHAVRQAALTAGMRILLIRRHGRQPRRASRSWGVLRYDARGDHRQEWGTWSQESDLAEIIAAIDRPGETGHPPLYLACTHGIHDACCAIRGRPIAGALSQHWPENTWECSHVGGDRYAGNLLVVPDGIYFGDVAAPTAVTVVQQLREGLVAADHLRGYADLQPAQQYAVAEVLRRFGPAGRHAIRVVATKRSGDAWSVSLACDAPLPSRVHVQLKVVALPAARLTCLAPAETRAIEHQTLEFVAET